MLSPSNGYLPVAILYLLKQKRMKFEIELFIESNLIESHSVTPELQMSTLKPENVSSPLAISGG